jgi:hypothetical protein
MPLEAAVCRWSWDIRGDGKPDPDQPSDAGTRAAGVRRRTWTPDLTAISDGRDAAHPGHR